MSRLAKKYKDQLDLLGLVQFEAKASVVREILDGSEMGWVYRESVSSGDITCSVGRYGDKWQRLLFVGCMSK